MSKLNVDAKEAVALASRLWGGTLELKENGFRLKAPGLNLALDVRRIEFEGTVESGLLKADVQRLAVRETGIEIDFALQ